MAKTALVNPRRRRRRVYGRRRRRNVGIAEVNRRRRRRRRRNPEVMVENRRYRRRARRRYYTRRRRNPSTGSRMANPFVGDIFSEIMTAVPPAAASILGCRWAMHVSGDMPKSGKPELWQAAAIIAWANFGSRLIGQVFGDCRAEIIAKIAAYGWGGDLFARHYLLADSKWAQANMFMGEDDEYYVMSGLETSSPIGAASPYVVGPDGTVYQVEGVGAYNQPSNYRSIMSDVGGLVPSHALGAEFGPYSADASSSFGYRVR